MTAAPITAKPVSAELPEPVLRRTMRSTEASLDCCTRRLPSGPGPSAARTKAWLGVDAAA